MELKKKLKFKEIIIYIYNKMQLSNLENLSKENIIFHEPREFQLKNSNIKYKRIKIEMKYPNGKTGALVLETPFLFSFGVNERKNQETNQLTGYSILVCLWKKDANPNKGEQDFYNALNKIHNICQEYLAEEYADDASTSFGEILYYKQIEYVNAKGKTKKKKDESASPVLYVKLIYSDKTKKILSLFRTKGNQNINPFDYLNQYFNTKMALIVKSIYLGTKIISL